ncbi:unnamed protein product [Toxocara canis]|uniref:Uncharacterized protein n=1 Tax=Toxocara canis TaxID=6265 RepID=A0A3P7HGR2_TOXCA|nr:unnamed protein product [Toxocara canis]
MIMTELESLDYEFGANDPGEFGGERLHFYRAHDSMLIASGIIIEGIQLFNDEHMGPMVYKVVPLKLLFTKILYSFRKTSFSN